ncbi:MAG: GldG family protein [Anaerolineae bacterium]|nr:GldG family protein [Anaerolineae bacterium]
MLWIGNMRWDWTEDQENTLAPETIEILETLPGKVEVRGYFTSQNPAGEDRAKDLLDDFVFFGGSNIEYQIIDPNANPVAATDDGITRDGTLVLELDGNKEQVTLVNEQEMASSIVRLLNPGDQKVYFLVGHGEFNFEESGDTSLNQLKQALEDRNYTPESLSLLATNAIPEDAQVLVIAGPNVPLSSVEVTLLSGFLDNGGAVVVLYEPIAVTQFGNNPDPLTAYLTEIWGIAMNNDIVIDLTSQEAFVAIAAQYGDHVITQRLQSLATVFPTARSVQAGIPVDGISKTELVFTAQQSWAETNIASINSGQIAPDDGQDLFGPVPLAVVANNSLTGGEIDGRRRFRLHNQSILCSLREWRVCAQRNQLGG